MLKSEIEKIRKTSDYHNLKTIIKYEKAQIKKNYLLSNDGK